MKNLILILLLLPFFTFGNSPIIWGPNCALNLYDNTCVGSSGGGITDLNSLTALSQFFATGTSGSDFNISSVSDTHTFNLPTASASARGLLSFTDWSTFNAKQNAITQGNLTEAVSSVLTISGGTNSVIGSGTSLQVKQASSSQNGYLSSANWTTFNNKLGSVVAPLVNTATVVSIPQASSSVNGYLSSSDWTTFNNKLSKVSGNYITNPDAEIDTSGWNLYNNTGRTNPATVVIQDITYTSALSGGGGNGATITYGFCGSVFAPPVVTCPTASSVNLCWYNGPTLAQNPTATQVKTAFDATPCAVAIATSAITGTASNLQYESGTSTLVGGGDTVPTTGTGGTATGVTFTRTTLNPIAGVASFDLGKDANSRLGDGVSTDFIINAVDTNSILQISFAYSASSGMTLGTNSDVQVFAYDITNATLIPVTPLRTLAGPVSTIKTFVGEFLTTTSVQYRLILHIASASTTAWDLELDQFLVNDQLDPTAATEVPSVVLQAEPISGAVTDHMVVMWKDGASSWVPATIAGAALPTFGDDQTQLGFATNIIGSEADIYVKGYMGGFSFGPFVNFAQYIDNTAGGISPLPSPFTDLWVQVGMAISSTALNIDFVRHVDQISNSSGVPIKGGLLTSSAVNDGTGDVVLSPGTNGTYLMANSAAANGISWTAPVATTPLSYTASTHTFSLPTASQNFSLMGPTSGSGNSSFRAIVAADIPTLNQNTTGSAATWTTARNLAGNSVNGSANVAFANKFIVQGTTDAGLSGPQFLGALGTGLVKNTTTTGVLSIAAASDTTGVALTGFVSGSGTITAADTILTGFNKINGNDLLKAPLASPTFTGTVTLPSSNLVNGASAATNASIVYKDSHIKSTMTTPPTSVVAAGAGTGATCTIAHASDSAGIITLTTGSVGTPTTGTQCTLTFNKAYATIPVCVFSPANSNAGSNLVLFSVGTSTTTTQPFSFGLAGGTTTAYVYNYQCMETQ